MNIRTYIMENEFKIIVLDNKINIVNYTSIELLSETKIIIKNNESTITINGQDLSITKLLIDEILIRGIFKNIEFR